MKPLSVTAAIWLAVLLLMGSNAGMSVIGFLLYAYGGAPLLVWWLVRTVSFGFARRRNRDQERPPLWHWLVVPACLIIATAVNAFDGTRNPLFLIRFRLSEPALRREAERLLGTPEARDGETRRVGLFHVQRSTVYEGQVRFITASCGVVDSCGVVYSQISPPKRLQEDTFVPLGNRWWHIYERF